MQVNMDNNSIKSIFPSAAYLNDCYDVLPTHHHPAPPHQRGSCHQTCTDLHAEVKHVKFPLNPLHVAQLGLKGAAQSLTFVLAGDAW